MGLRGVVATTATALEWVIVRIEGYLRHFGNRAYGCGSHRNINAIGSIKIDINIQIGLDTYEG